MGARQSKRSVDITTGKEAVIADGEGKVELIQDADANLKPQLNGDAAHEEIQISDKEKILQQDEAPENEKDIVTEKEIILTPVINGSGEAETPVKEEVAEKTPEPDSNKKPKKEKVKKKFLSFRSISFSKKDKTKPAKKEETNGECEKVNEEGGDNQEAAQTESPVAETPKENSEAAEKAPETPVTEPLTNGSSTPESPKEEVIENGEPAKEESSPPEVAAAPAPVVEEKPADTSVNGLSLNGLKIEDEKIPDVEIPKVEEVPAPEISKSPVEAEVEVCVPPPVKEEVEAPPLPTTPPPSNLAMFAESTMATHLVTNSIVDEAPVVDVESSVPVTEKEIDSPVIENKVDIEQIEQVEPVVPVPDITENVVVPPSSEEVVPDSDSVAVVSSKCDIVNDSGIGEIDQSVVTETVADLDLSLPAPPLESLDDSIDNIPPPLVLSDNLDSCPPPLDSFSPPPPPESCSESISETLPSDSLPPPYSESPEVPDIPAPVESLPTETVPVAHTTNGIASPTSEHATNGIEEPVEDISDETIQPQVKSVSDVIEQVSAPEPVAIAVESATTDSTAE